jgi:hypothetical protein
MDLGFWPGDKIAFEHESGHPYIARVVMREDKGLLLKRGGVEEAFLVPWDRVIGKLLFSHFMPDAVSEELAAIRVVYVFGGVVKPGAVTWREGLTVGDAIQASGGVVPLADIKKLKVVRKKDTMVMAIPAESPETVLNVLLQAGDEIVIPQ